MALSLWKIKKQLNAGLLSANRPRANIRIAVKNCQRLWIIFYNRQRLPENGRRVLIFDNYSVLTFFGAALLDGLWYGKG
ncbi:hypothetical protein [Eikenella corrodens]|uniref:hypothetical protein n=1 Tax=Eikenella corrodens TaxID=539 RepID=UPI0012DA85A2|nr:hypothetical protein [Eikenella corrodens]